MKIIFSPQKTNYTIDTQKPNEILPKPIPATDYTNESKRNFGYFVAFKSNLKGLDYASAKNYLEYKKTTLTQKKLENLNIYHFDLDKLNGIQKDIKVFEGLNMKEIAFLCSELTEIAVFRGCYNNCAHCYAEAKPPAKETSQQISKMDWGDFKSLTDGISELNKRLGFNICGNSDTEYMTAFHDADCSQIYLKDKDGKIHDWLDINEIMQKTFKHKQLFDTAGWYIQDKTAQERMEKYIQKLVENPDNIEFNISANPYHAMHFRAVKEMKQDNKEKEYFFRQKDIQRMANVLFTCTPLLNIEETDDFKFSLLARAMDPKSKNSKGISTNDLRNTYKNYFKELKKLYEEDYNGEQKIIKNKRHIQRYIYEYEKKLNKITTSPSITKELKNLYEETDRAVLIAKKSTFQDPKEILKHEFFTLVDANGDIYVTNFYESYKTDLKLNFKNSNKKTAPIAPNLCTERITKKLINDYKKTF